jgi:hypothetical protein
VEHIAEIKKREKKNVYWIFVCKPKTKLHFGDKSLEKKNIKMNVKQRGCWGVDWILLDKSRFKWRVL